jgi:thymidylate kinase
MVGQSLLFLADYAEIAKAAAQIDDSEGRIIVQDRGLLSKLVYQLVVLRRSIGERRARKLLSAIIEELPKPDVTVLLDAPMRVIQGLGMLCGVYPASAASRYKMMARSRKD